MNEFGFTRSDQAPYGRVAGLGIAAGAALSVFAIAHHPTVQPSEMNVVVPEMIRLGFVDRIVHGSVILCLIVFVYGFSIFALRLGLRHPAVVAGIVAFTLGAVALIGAALVDGFVVPGLAEHYAVRAPEILRSAEMLFVLCSTALQVLTKFGLVSMSFGVLAWSLHLLRSGGKFRSAGVVGCGSALFTIGLLAATRAPLNPHSIGMMTLAQALWYFTAAGLLVRRLV